jgi:hypothetical protein
MAYIPNFEWTVGDADRAKFAFSKNHLSADEVYEMLQRGPYACERDRFDRVCRGFGVRFYGDRRQA